MKHILLLLVCVWLSLVTATGFAAHTQAPSIQLPAITGDVDLSQRRGKVVYLDFWASWCEPCRESFPWMAKLKDKYGNQGLEVIAVNLDKERAKADAFLETMEINFIVAFDPVGETASKYELRGMPGSYLIGRDGNIHASHLGFRHKDKEKLESAIQRLLQQGQGVKQ
ncbi:MAG: TlpA disulfide reductase family protein [Gammaproteobacteria bacterium]|jgi:thiol-disulfide isomerase/thioredoxin